MSADLTEDIYEIVCPDPMHHLIHDGHDQCEERVDAIERILTAHLAAVEAERDRIVRTMRAQDAANDRLMQQLADLRASITALAETRIDGELNGHVVPMPMVWAADVRALLNGGRLAYFTAHDELSNVVRYG